ncbi:MAG: hypothetical protein LAT75_12195 [Candidatus Cyclonatronum sp.]|uniref:pyridoxal phosphate-dependent decarboxylase family protein n=1 Tax=Cyclonatronum sp. TaxID=3024185 RepID=UPI0025BF2069|nr:pyridoxal-dependent decarboxylase [Cyclonatronum sp.]MCH8487620.1 hypothetical protein [Cyclonatronum sp.]
MNPTSFNTTDAGPASEHITHDLLCEPGDIALKSFFLGPQAENSTWVREILDELFDAWFDWRKALYSSDGPAISESDMATPEFLERRETIRKQVGILMRRLQNEVPSFSPRYIGHMITEVSMPALIGHIVTLLYNPNNISGESSRVGILIEDEAVRELLAMVGYSTEAGTGHFTSGGTVANLEGALRARDRFAKWLAAGAISRKYGDKTFNMFDSCLMGWNNYDRIRFEYELNDDDLRPYHILKGNPVHVIRNLDQVYDMDYAGPVVLVPENKHYSWNKAVDIMGLGEEAFVGVETDEHGRMCVAALRKTLENCRQRQRPPLMVVSVAGTTELGEMDPIHEVQAVLDEYRELRGWHIWHHVDAAYGGFLCSLDMSAEVVSENMRRALGAIREANSVTIDPHKLGYVPYASGAFLCQTRREYFYRKSIAPYINFVGTAERGPQTIEGSRSAAGAVSTWLTARTIGLNAGGYGRILERTIQSRIRLEAMLGEAHPLIRIFPHAETNIITFCIARESEALGVSNARTLAVYKAFSPEENHEFYVSKTTLKRPAYDRLIDEFTGSWQAVHDTPELVLIRLTVMNPFFDTKDNLDYPTAFTAKLKTVID